MARKQDENLRPAEHKFTLEEHKKGAQRSAEVRRQKKTIADYLKNWANQEVSEKDRNALKAAGLDEEATNKTLLVLPLIKKANGGDLKALQLIIELLNEDNKKDLEIKKLQAEIELLKAQTQKITLETDSGEVEKIEVVNDVPNV